MRTVPTLPGEDCLVSHSTTPRPGFGTTDRVTSRKLRSPITRTAGFDAISAPEVRGTSPEGNSGRFDRVPPRRRPAWRIRFGWRQIPRDPRRADPVGDGTR